MKVSKLILPSRLSTLSAVGVALQMVTCSAADPEPLPFEVGGSAGLPARDDSGRGGGAATSGRAGSAGRAGRGGFGSGGRATPGDGGTAGRSGAFGGGGAGGRLGAAGRPGAGGAAGSSTCPSTPLSGGTPHCSSNAQGNIGSYSWTIWSSGSGGCITPYGVGAAFKATWNNSGDFLARVGLGFGSNQRPDQLGTLSAEFSETKTGTAGNFSYIGIYGWSVNPLHEYYIVDDWFGSRPNPGGTKVGSFTVDDDTYDVYTHTQVNQPAITGGNQTFEQFFSIRQTARQCGHISISEHFKQWNSLGLTLGNLVEARVLVEAGGGSGSIDFTNASVTVW